MLTLAKKGFLSLERMHTTLFWAEGWSMDQQIALRQSTLLGWTVAGRTSAHQLQHKLIINNAHELMTLIAICINKFQTG